MVLRNILFILMFSSSIVQSQVNNFGEQNKKEIDKVLNYFKKKGDKQQYESALFIINNMPIHYGVDNIWMDKNNKQNDFKATSYPDIEVATKAFNKLKDSLQLKPKEVVIRDETLVKSSFLIANIELAFKAWKQNPWSQSYNFETFCNYILPYRSLTEPLQDWRSDYQLYFEKLKNNMEDKTDPVELCSKIIMDTKQFDFVLKRFDPKPLLGANELLFWRQGNCPDLANMALFASRALGIAVTFDYTPHFAASSNRHYWNTVIDNKGTHIPFNGNQVLPYTYNALTKRLGKVFRVTYAQQKTNLPYLINESEIPAEFLKSRNIIDVTAQYVPVTDIAYHFNANIKQHIAYINVFNRGAWLPIHWATIKQGKTSFTAMGRDIVYLPSVYNIGKMDFEQFPILLDTKGTQTTLKPDFNSLFTASLSRDNEVKSQYTDHNPFQIIKGEKYTLYVWNGNWQLIAVETATYDNKISYAKVPKNGLFLMAPLKPDFFERIFTINPQTNTITWY